LNNNQMNEANHLQQPQEQADADEQQQQQRIQTVALEMRTASIYNYNPTKTHVCCVINKHYTVRKALTIGGDHCTQCAWCLRNDPDECFWIMHNIHMGMLGCQVKMEET